MSIRSLRSERGDTIVEVLIAVAIASSVLVSAFTVVRHTLNNTQQAHEHTEAVNYVQGQIEQLKGLAGQSGNAVFSQTAPFCVNSGTITTNMASCRVGTDNRYQLSIVPPTAGNNTFTVNSNWEGPEGRAEKVNMKYVLYP
jgi:type II secretory pathway pseudopilin PulG